jgi:mannitol/fructose-specific phosphotransferase system IIA component (Ntr-type)
VFDVAVGRLKDTVGPHGYAIAADLKQREKDVSSAIGGGVAMPSAYTRAGAPAAVLVTLAKPLKHDTPDKQGLRLVILLAGPRSSPERRVRLVHLARLVSRGLCERLVEQESPARVLSRLALLESAN